MHKRFLALILAILTIFNALGCGSSQSMRPNIGTTDGDAGILVSPDVSLLGLPDDGIEDAGPQASDASPLVPNGQNGELIVPLRRDAQAPFNGVLLNGPAVARISVEFQSQQQRCLIERNRDVSLVVARYNADVASLRLAMDTQERTANVLLSGRDQDIARLSRLLQSQTSENSGPHVAEGLIWAGGGLLVGVLVVGGIVIFANSHP